MIAPAFSTAIAAAAPTKGEMLAVGVVVAFSLAELLAEVVAELLAESLVELLVELVAEALAESLVELLVELVAETLAESLVELLVELLAELLAELLDEEPPDPGETKEPPEIPPEGTVDSALPAFSLNAARLSPPLGGFITATIPDSQCWLWPQYNQIGFVSPMVTAKTWLDCPEDTGTNPEKIPPLIGLQGLSKADWMTEWFCG